MLKKAGHVQKFWEIQNFKNQKNSFSEGAHQHNCTKLSVHWRKNCVKSRVLKFSFPYCPILTKTTKKSMYLCTLLMTDYSSRYGNLNIIHMFYCTNFERNLLNDPESDIDHCKVKSTPYVF